MTACTNAQKQKDFRTRRNAKLVTWERALQNIANERWDSTTCWQVAREALSLEQVKKTVGDKKSTQAREDVT